jgi:uncharacterized protein
MADPSIFEQLVADNEHRTLPTPTPRRIVLPALSGKVDAVIGMRRSGKTWLLFQTMRELQARGTAPSRTLYVNFEDERLLPLDPEDLDRLLQAYYRRHPENRRKECRLFFDEIQNVPGWEAFVRRVLDTEKVRITVTGSSARLLGREIATSLRGRSIATGVQPFSFEEALAHHGVEVPNAWPPSSPVASELMSRFDQYLQTGGFPEVLTLRPELRIRILQGYVDVALFRDVVERHGVGNLPVLRYLIRRFLENPGGKFSVNRIYGQLRSQGYRTSKDSLYEYVDHLEEAFFLFAVPIAADSEKARMVNPRKVYPADHGLAGAFVMKPSRDLGHHLETIVAVELRRRGYSLAYVVTSRGNEVDFLARKPGRESLLVQVCAGIHEEETLRRELRGLEEAAAEHPDCRRLLITLHDIPHRSLDPVCAVPIWRWLLEGPPGL